MVKEIIVLRYGHREVRDYRVTSHCALVARAFGAKEIIVCGGKDISMKTSVDDITKRWGGPFTVKFIEEWKDAYKELKKRKFIFVHLTMYGSVLTEKEKEIGKHDKVCVIIGSQKVEREVYDKVNYNISVTSQPHSEIAALAVFLDRIQEGKELTKIFKKGKIQIAPQERGKKVISLNSLVGKE